MHQGAIDARRCRLVSTTRHRAVFWVAYFWFAFGLTALTATVAVAQKLQVETFTVEDGLPSSTILDLAQDATGRIWILSRAGITVYDGRELRTQSSADGLPNHHWVALEADSDGVIWTVGRSTKRAFFYAGSAWQGLPPPPPNPRPAPIQWATSLALVDNREDPSRGAEQHIVIGTTDAGLLIWNGESWSALDTSDGLPDNYVTSLAAAGDKLYVSTSQGLCALADDELDCFPQQIDPRLTEQIHALHVDPTSGDLWILGKTWLARLRHGKLSMEAEGLTLMKHDQATYGSLAIDPVGGIYFGSPRLAYFEDPHGKIRTLGPREGLASEGLTSILVDRESNVWLGGLRGLSKIASQRFVTFDRDAGLLDDEVTAILEASPGRWILGHNTGLTFLDETGLDKVGLDKTGVETLELQPLTSDQTRVYRVLDLAMGDDGVVWAAAHGFGLVQLEADRSWTTATLEGAVYSVEVDANGVVWTTTHGSLYVRQDATFSRVETGFEETAGMLRWIVEGADGRLYIAANRGLLWREGTTWRFARGPTDEASNVFNVLVDTSGKIWVGTAAGLFTLRDDELIKVDGDGPRVDSPVYFVIEDSHGRIWIGTDNGLRVWDGDTSRHLTLEHGLAGRETNRGAGLVDSRGQIWIGTDQGLSRYQESYDTISKVAPSVEVRAVEAGGRHWSPQEPIELAHYESTLVFHIDTISFSREQDVLYRYLLEGFDAAWLGPEALSGSEIRYTNLEPGRYRFRIAASRDGAWSEEAVAGSIHIVRPFWRQGWFYAASIALAVCAMLAVHGLWTHAIRARNRELEALTGRLNTSIRKLRHAQDEREELITDLEAKNAELERFTYTVSHDLKSPLVTIKGFLGLLEKDAVSGDVDRMRRDIERISGAAGRMGQLLDELLELSRIGRVTQHPEAIPFADLAHEVIRLVSGRLESRRITIDVESELPVIWGDRTRLLEVVQNLVDNAIRFIGEQPSPRIEIGARKGPETAPGMALLYVADNGIGIEPRYQEKVFGLFERLDQDVEGTGVGLALVRRIVEVHGGRIWIESEGAGRGSTFLFTLPVEAEESQ